MSGYDGEPCYSYRASVGEPDRPAHGFAGGSGRGWERKPYRATDLKGGRSGTEAHGAG